MATQDLILNMNVQGNAAQQLQQLATQARVLNREAVEANQRIQQATAAAAQAGNIGDYALMQLVTKQQERAQQAARVRLVAKAATAQPFDPTEEAFKRQDRDRQEREVKRQLFQIDPSRYKDPDAEAAGTGRGGLLAGTGFQRFLGPSFVGHAIFGAFEHATKSLDTFGADLDGLHNPARDMALAFAEGIPILGGLFRGLHNLWEATSGLASARAGNAEFLRIANPAVQANVAQLAAQFRGRQQTDAARQAETLAGINADAANALVSRFGTDPGLRQRLRDLRTGSAETDVARAEEAAAAARQRVGAGEREFSRQGESLPQLRARVEQLSGEEILFARRRDEAERTLREAARGQNMILAGNAGVGDLAARALTQSLNLRGADVGAQARIGMEGARTDQETKLGQLLKQREELQRQLNAQQEAGKNLQAAQKDLAQKELELAQARLGVQKIQLEQTRGMAQAFGGAEQPEKFAAIEAARRARQFGFEALTPDEKGLVGRFAPDFAVKEQQAAGQRDPLLREFRGVLGLPQVDLEKQGDAVNKAVLENAAKNADAIKAVASAFTDRLTQEVVAIVKNETEGLHEKLRKEQLQGQGRPQ